MRQPSIASSAVRLKSARNGSSRSMRIYMRSFTLKVVCITKSLFRPMKTFHFVSKARHACLLTSRERKLEAITASLSTLSVDAQKRAEKDSKKKEAKAAAAEAREAEAKKEAMVYIKRVERNKRKYVTAVSGLEAHGMDLKKIAKEFGKKCEWLFFGFAWATVLG